MLEGSIAFTLSGATELKRLGFGSLTIGLCGSCPRELDVFFNTKNCSRFSTENGNWHSHKVNNTSVSIVGKHEICLRVLMLSFS